MTAIKEKQQINFDQVYELIQKNEVATTKLIQLYNKWNEQMLNIGFTGHFSAGKSSMINAIINEDLLPSSPIPTSANIVEIRHGDEKVVYHLNDGNFAIDNEINIETVKSLSKNGEAVKSLTIYKHLPLLEQSISLIDTPGIDSSDDLEFERTLNQVHLIDHFIYVMDYNHVQSEVNFTFLSELEKRNVPYFVVVNQIDKHNEYEISFASYKRSLINSLKAWELKPERIFFTSLKYPNHELNEFSILIGEINQLISKKNDLIENKIVQEISLIVNDYLESNLELEDHDAEKLFKIERNMQHFEEEINSIQVNKEKIEQSLNNDISKILNNAYLMDFETRDFARQYLESVQPKFKVGSFFSKKKTEEEKDRRKLQFINRINEKIKTEIIWHLRQFLLNEINLYQISDEQLIDHIQTMTIEIDETVIKEVISHDANISGEYILVFSDQLFGKIKQIVKSEMNDILNQMMFLLKNHFNDEIEQFKTKLTELTDEYNQLQSVKQTLHEHTAKKDTLLTNIFATDESHIVKEKATAIERSRQQLSIEKIISKNEEELTNIKEIKNSNVEIDISQIMNQADKYLNEIREIQYLEPFKLAIEKRLKQLNEVEFTVSLFGAFSAGKSSFANAWIGENILPSSPNPTTAAINRIRPVNETYEHGDVLIIFKTEERLTHQLSQIISSYTDEKAETIEELYQLIQKRLSYFNDVLSQTESSFLQAFLNGYDEMREALNTTRKVSLDELDKYVSVEKISSFVEQIDIFYDCELTRQGVTLVDTPGADSIHSRHTNVAMHYVKHSDLIIYVNYYNHAFSRADREFLIQLGQVKDSFSLDKMFFILNASDLAKTNDELMMVQNYLNDQLQQYGINNPVIFPTSSKEIMNNPNLKIEHGEYRKFYDRFAQFIEKDAKSILANGLQYEINRLVSFINQSIREAEEDQDKQIEIIKQNQFSLKKVENWMNELNKRPSYYTIEQEINEITHYLKQRIMIQLIDMMKEAINPATIQSNGKKGRDELKIAIKQLFNLLNEKLTKEYQTTQIILDKTLNRTLHDVIKEINEYIDQETNFSKIFFEEREIEFKDYQNKQQIHDSELNQFVTIFKSKKEFFEQNKIKLLYEQLEETMSQMIDNLITNYNSVLQAHYVYQFDQHFEEIINRFINSNKQMIEIKEKLLSDQELIKQFKNIAQLS